jgi:endogenous inhibitor of DNA gyrase (YacG/DUF329 family)
MARTQNKTITIKAEYLSGQIKNGRVKAGEKLHLDVSRIRRIFAWQQKYYVEYETPNADYYKQYIESPPPYAVALKHRVEEYKVDICNKCGRIIEWDADEPFCPRGCHDYYDDWDYREETRQRFVVDSDDEVKQFIEKALGIKAERADSLRHYTAGGFTPLFKLVEIDAELFKSRVVGVAVVENPTFEHTDYDSIDVAQKKYEGRYIVVARRIEYGHEYLLFRYQGEPNLALLDKLHQEYVEKERKEKEKRRRSEEEIERRRREEEEKWDNPQRVIDAIKRALPEWADGAVVVAKSVCGEDCDVYHAVYPVKRSKYGDGYYYSPEWKTLNVGVPDRFLEKFEDYTMLRDGKTLKVKQGKNGSDKYVTLKPA